MLPRTIQETTQQLRRLPGVGTRSSQKLSLDILNLTDEQYQELQHTLDSMRKEVVFCKHCGFFAQVEDNYECSICLENSRKSHQICLVEKPTDVISVEKSQIYRGRYHVLNHLISPLDSVYAEDTTIAHLIEKRIPALLDEHAKVELILFFKAGFASEATTAYLRETLKKHGLHDMVSITRLAQGLPLYFNPDTLDQATMAKALEDRREVLL